MATPIIDDHPHKPQMEPIALRDAISLSLWAGQMLLQNGADSQRVEETVHRIGTGLGCDWMDVLVTPDGIIASTINNQEFRTKVRRAPFKGTNMTIISEINTISRLVTDGALDRIELRKALRRVDNLAPEYNRWAIVLGVGISCACFSRLFGGDLTIFLVTFCASALAMFVRQELHHQHFNPMINTIITAFVAGAIAGFAVRFQMGNKPTTAISAAVLLLVPGVPLFNSVNDLIRGYMLNGIARGVQGGVQVLGIALGLALAIWIMGIAGL